MNRLKKLNKFYKISSCKNLGNIIDTNSAINLIQDTYGSKFMGSNQVYSFSGNLEAVYGYIADDGFIASELYCFKQDDNKFIGVIVAQKFYIDNSNNVTPTESLSCQAINDSDNTMTIYQLLDLFTNGSYNLCGINCTFSKKIDNFDTLHQELKVM